MQLIQDLPAIFEEFGEQRRNSFVNALELKKKGIPMVGVFCTFLPMEFIHAIGAVPVGLCSVSDETIPQAEEDLPRNLCPLIKSSYGFAKTDKCPYFYFSDLVIGETTCDGKKKMFEYLADFKPVYVMELPNTQSENALQLWVAELHRLKDKLEEQFGVEITDEKLREAVHMKNEERKALRAFYETMKLDPPPMQSREVFNVLRGADFRFDKRELVSSVHEVTQGILERENVNTKKPRLLITGCPIGGVFDKLFTCIEDADAYAVAFENCGGAKSLAELVDEEADDIYEAIARRYLNIGCSCMYPNPNRLQLLDEIIDEYKIDGVLDIVLQACHTYSVETLGIKRFVSQTKHTPYMAIETDYSTNDIEQLRTRIAAFVEML